MSACLIVWSLCHWSAVILYTTELLHDCIKLRLLFSGLSERNFILLLCHIVGSKPVLKSRHTMTCAERCADTRTVIRQHNDCVRKNVSVAIVWMYVTTKMSELISNGEMAFCIIVFCRVSWNMHDSWALARLIYRWRGKRNFLNLTTFLGTCTSTCTCSIYKFQWQSDSKIEKHLK